jgi:hypothetical protein
MGVEEGVGEEREGKEMDRCPFTVFVRGSPRP